MVSESIDTKISWEKDLDDTMDDLLEVINTHVWSDEKAKVLPLNWDPDPNMPNYDELQFIGIRDWTNSNDYDMGSVLSYISRKSKKLGRDLIITVNNPYAKALSQSFPGGRHYSESYSPTMRCIQMEDKHILDDYIAMRGERVMSRDIDVTFKETDDHDWHVNYMDDGIKQSGIHWWLYRPAELVMNKRSMKVGASDFVFLPPIELKGFQLLVYGLNKIIQEPLIINNLSLTFTEAPESNRSNLPGGWRWGIYQITLNQEQRDLILGIETKTSDEIKDSDILPEEIDIIVRSWKINGVWLQGQGPLHPLLQRLESGRPKLVLATHQNNLRCFGKQDLLGKRVKINGIPFGSNGVTLQRNPNKDDRYDLRLTDDEVNYMANLNRKVQLPKPKPVVFPPENELADVTRVHARVIPLAEAMALWRDIDVGMQAIFIDSAYTIIPLNLWQEIINETKINENPYQENIRDCDDYAWRFKGTASWKYGINGCGFVMSILGRHAFIAILVDNEDGTAAVRFVEPQSDKLVEHQPQTQYSLEQGNVIF